MISVTARSKLNSRKCNNYFNFRQFFQKILAVPYTYRYEEIREKGGFGPCTIEGENAGV